MGVGSVKAATIAGGECFIDHDPGEGNGIPMTCSDGACDEEWEELECAVDLNGFNLKIGHHIVYGRVRNDSGEWSMPRPLAYDPAIINPNLTIFGEKHIVAAECFFDTDPGPGQGFPCQCADGTFDEPDEEIQCRGVDVSCLSLGMHRLYFRMKDSDGLWGVIRSYTIQTYDPPILAAGEYFIDDDPGVGNGIPVWPKDGLWDEPEEEIELVIDASAYATANHLMRLRMKDSHQRWGLADCKPFGEDPCECDLNIDGRCDMQDWLLFGEDWGRIDCNQPGVECCECDLNGDGRCDMQDWLLFGRDWGEVDCPTCPSEFLGQMR
jgi:hypothetical protein